MITVPSTYTPEVQAAIWAEYYAGRGSMIARMRHARGEATRQQVDDASAAHTAAIKVREALK